MTAALQIANAATAEVPSASRRLSPAQWRLGIGIALFAALAAALFAIDGLTAPARHALLIFAAAVLAWALTRLPETGVALGAGIALAATGAIDSDALFAGLGDDIVWLLIGAFLIATVVRHSGLAERCILRALAGGASSPQRLFHRLTWLIAATAFVIPSTSGRAALLLPVFMSLAGAIRDPQVVRALALLFPSVILLSACASLLGAGAHLVAVDFIDDLGFGRMDYLDWLLLGTPFALLTSVIATELILRLFLDAPTRRAPIALPEKPRGPMSQVQRRVLGLVFAIVALWATTALHGIDPALIAIAGGLALASRAIGGIALKDAIKSVEWNLVLFLAVTLVLGEALISTGAAAWIARETVARLPAALLAHPQWVVIAAALVSMLSHLFITSRSARAAVLIPVFALPLALSPAHAVALVMVAVVGSGFCQTLRISAKPVALYHSLDGVQTYRDADLLRLSLWLMPPFAIALVVFALWLWPLIDPVLGFARAG
jgi:anion transporter